MVFMRDHSGVLYQGMSRRLGGILRQVAVLPCNSSSTSFNLCCIDWAGWCEQEGSIEPIVDIFRIYPASRWEAVVTVSTPMPMTGVKDQVSRLKNLVLP